MPTIDLSANFRPTFVRHEWLARQLATREALLESAWRLARQSSAVRKSDNTNNDTPVMAARKLTQREWPLVAIRCPALALALALGLAAALAGRQQN